MGLFFFNFSFLTSAENNRFQITVHLPYYLQRVNKVFFFFLNSDSYMYIYFAAVWGGRVTPNLQACVSFCTVCLTEMCQTGLAGSSPLFAQRYHLSVERKKSPPSLSLSPLSVKAVTTIENHSQTPICLYLLTFIQWSLNYYVILKQGCSELLIQSKQCRSKLKRVYSVRLSGKCVVPV